MVKRMKLRDKGQKSWNLRSTKIKEIRHFCSFHSKKFSIKNFPGIFWVIFDWFETNTHEYSSSSDMMKWVYFFFLRMRRNMKIISITSVEYLCYWIDDDDLRFFVHTKKKVWKEEKFSVIFRKSRNVFRISLNLISFLFMKLCKNRWRSEGGRGMKKINVASGCRVGL